MSTNPETIVGVIERFTFLSDDKTFGVAKFERNEGKSITISGNIGGHATGAYLELQGQWEYVPKYKAKQFIVALSMPAEATASPAALANFLAANFHNIGKVSSAKIVQHFGDLTISRLDEDPASIDEVPKLNRGMRKSIKDSWHKIRESHKGIRSIILAMHDERIGKRSISRATKSLRHMVREGIDVYSEVMHSPYSFLEHVDVGFQQADKIALRLGYPTDGEERRVYGMIFQVNQSLGQGCCLVEENVVRRNASQFLAIDTEKSQQAIEQCIKDALLFREDIDGRHHLMPAKLYHAEHGVADAILHLRRLVNESDIVDVNLAIESSQKDMGIVLNEEQIGAIRNTLQSGVSIVTGGPGTGKTTTLKGLIAAFRAGFHTTPKIALIAPTGRAAKRMEESTGIEAKTIHRELLFIESKEEDYIDADLVVVDEASMMDIELASSLLSKVRPGARLVIVGDKDQLPSIGPGRVLADLIQSKVIPVTQLKVAYRFEDGYISRNAHRVNQGLDIELPDPDSPTKQDDCFFIEITKPTDSHYGQSLASVIADRTVRMHALHIPAKKGADPARDVQTLVPMRVGPLGANALNIALRDAINPLKGQRTLAVKNAVPVRTDKKASDGNQAFSFREGDKVMQTTNDYDLKVFNGETGFIQRINVKNKSAIVLFEDREVEMLLAHMRDLDLAYATTIHKSQGSEYPYVVMPFSEGQNVMLERPLSYTGITRCKKMLIMMGQMSALRTSIQREKASLRITNLVDKLQEKHPRKKINAEDATEAPAPAETA